MADGTRAERYRAVTRYRGRDDKTRLIERFAPTKGAARHKLNAALATFDAEQASKASRAAGTLADAAATWLAQVDRNPDLSAKSKALYRYTWRTYVEPSDLATAPLTEVNSVPVLRGFLQGIADERGTGTAKSVRSVLSSVIGLAVEDGLLTMNATRSLRPVRAAKPKATVRDTRRALTKAQRKHLLRVADAHPRAQAQDVADVIAYLAGTGVRIGEALAQRWKDVDLKAGTVHVRGTKSRASDRAIALPPWLVERLRSRAEARGAVGVVFPSPNTTDRAKPRDQRNVARIIRDVLDAAGLPWATPHSLRRTVATLIHEAGLPVTAAQAQLGHADASMTMRVYLAKRDEPSQRVADAL